jgi:anaerobic selenocysteine-containing dehydrogenase
MKRRQFIILTGAGAASTTLLSACGHPEEKLVPALIPDDEYIPGIDVWKASTCQLCHAGCGILVRTREHKANKIEGNPAHPVNRGGLCARGQAGLEVLYNPDRIKAPMKRAGERGEGKWQEISWDEAIKTLADKLSESAVGDQTVQSIFVTTEANGVTADVAANLTGKLLAEAIVVAPLFNESAVEESYAESYGGPATFDLANATYLISFGARFLETWHSPMMYSQAYGEFRNSSGKTRGRFVQVEPRMSLTAANADEWLAAAPGDEHLVALAIANVILSEGLNRAPAPSNLAASIAASAPESVSAATGIPAGKLTRLAREFGKSERPLAIGSAPAAEMSAINLLNKLMDNVNKKGGILVRRAANGSGGHLKTTVTAKRPTELSHAQFPEALRTRPVRALLIHSFNPVFVTPEVRDSILQVPFVASFSPILDETGALADLLLPDHSYLERWDLRPSFGNDGAQVLSLSQPVIEAQLNTRQTADILIEVARTTGGPAVAALPQGSASDIVESAVGDLKTASASQTTQAEKDDDESPNPFWDELTARGFVSTPATGGQRTDAGSRSESPSASGTASSRSQSPNVATPRAEPPARQDNALTLIVYETFLGDGRAASLPSIQEFPDPMTSVLWGSWLEINHANAQSLGV